MVLPMPSPYHSRFTQRIAVNCCVCTCLCFADARDLDQCRTFQTGHRFRRDPSENEMTSRRHVAEQSSKM